MVPSTTAAAEEIRAMRMESQVASKISLLFISAPYHLVEKPPHTVTSSERLKEYTTSTSSGI